MKGLKLITLVLSLLMITSCVSKYKPDLKGKNKSPERVALVKSFAVDFFAKCEKQDYTEMQGYKMDFNLKNKLNPENIKKSCDYYNKTYGTITVGDLAEAKSNYSPKDFLDYFIFKAKGSKNDSVKSVRVNIYRDNNIFERISIPRNKTTQSKR